MNDTVNQQTDTSSKNLRNAIFNRRMLICVFTGFSSGLPLFVLITLLPAWLRKEGVDLVEIGLFSLVGLPYAWKFIWAPVMDRFSILPIGRRRSWMLLIHVILLLAIASLGQFQPQSALTTIATLAALTAFFSASLDIVIDAYRRELLPDEELGLGNAIHVNAYRIAGLIPGSLALILADHLAWPQVFFIVGLFMLPGMAMVLLVDEIDTGEIGPRTMREAIVEPFIEFVQRLGRLRAFEFLAFLFFYKLGDSMATALATPFYIDLGFSLTEIGAIAKNAALWPSIIGGILGGILMLRIGIYRALWLFGVVQIVSILGFVWLAEAGNDKLVLAIVISFEYLGVGLGTTAFVAFIASNTNIRYTATQFALFTALTAIPRTFANSITGILVEGVNPAEQPTLFETLQWLGLPEDGLGWMGFYWFCTICAVPGMLLLFRVAPWNGEAHGQHSNV